MTEPDPREILRALEQGAVRHGAEASRDMGEEDLDVLDALRDNGGATTAPDMTLGGYTAVHERPPAFEGADGQPYTVAVDTTETGDPERPFAGFLIFLRWAATGAGIMAHVETPDLAFGATADEAERALLELSLYEVKAELDAAIERKQRDIGD